MPTIYQGKLWRYAWHFFAFLYKYDGGMLTISLHFFINMMEGCLPFLNEDDGDMLGISLHFFINMMEGCSPSPNEEDGDMLTISLNFFINGKMLTISQ